MQVFVRCGFPVGTLAVDCEPCTDSVGDVKERLCATHTLGPSGQLRLQYGSRALPDDLPLDEVAGLGPGSTMLLSSRLRGGGGDGGSTGAESRSCYLEMYLGKKADKVNPAEELLANWTRCHLSGEVLTPPCVVDDLGYLYNKEAVIHHLLNKTIPASLSYITGLKSVMEIKLQRQEQQRQAKAAASQVSFQPGNDTDFSCPVTGVPFNGRGKFVALRPSGLVVSEKALKEVPAVVEDMIGGKWNEDDVIPINPTGEALEQQRAKLGAKLVAERDKKKAKKAAKSGTDAAGAAAVNGAQKRSASPEAAAPGGATAAAKRAKKSLELAPAGATKEVFASIFTSSSKQDAKETFCCRSLGARGVNLT